MKNGAWVVTRNKVPIAVSMVSRDSAMVRAEHIARTIHQNDIKWEHFPRMNEERLMAKSKETGRWRWTTFAVKEIPMIDYGLEHKP